MQRAWLSICLDELQGGLIELLHGLTPSHLCKRPHLQWHEVA